MSARDEILTAVRLALGPEVAVPEVPRLYETSAPPDLTDRFISRLEDYHVTVHRSWATVGPLDGFVRAPGVELSEVRCDDAAMTTSELDTVAGVVTGCAVAIAETGTLVLDGSPQCGRRILTLIPDRHICIVRETQIVPGISSALARVDPGRPITLISGPSASSDIGFERVEGVHGPRRLEVVVLP